MTDYVTLFMSLASNSALDTGDMQQLINEGLYTTPSLFSVDRAALWLLNSENDTYTCEADFFNDSANDKTPSTLAKSNDSALFEFLINSDEIIIDDVDTYASLDINMSEIASAFQVCSILLIPIHIKGINRGFIFLGDSKKPTQWASETLFACKILAQLFSRAVLALDNKTVETELLHQHQLMKEIESLSKVGGWDYEIATGKISWTDETFQIYGVSTEHILGPSDSISFYSPEARVTIKEAFELAISQLKPYELELPFIDAKGNHKWVKTTGQIRSDAQGQPTHIYGAIEDISEEKRLLDTQASTSQNLRAVVDNLNDSIVTISSTGIIRSANRMVEKTFGYSPDELIGKNVSMLMPEPFASRHDKYMHSYLQSGDAKIIGIGRELPAMKKDGSTFPMELSISEVLHVKEKVFIGIVRDITERKKAEQAIHKLAYYDETTGILNRYSFEQALQKAFNKSSLVNENLTVFLVNLDRFSQINLAYGETNGDEILQETAKRISHCLPKACITYRNNADSFYVILGSCDHTNLDSSLLESNVDLANLVLKEIRQPIRINKLLINVQASIGIIDTPAKELNYTDIKPLLELAVSNAKKNGGNSYVFSDKSEASILKRFSELSLAMKSKTFIDELDLALQPQYSINGDIVGSEALVRWISPSLGFVSPAEFIPLAERNGAIIKLGDWVIEKTCTLIAQRQQYSTESSPVSINLSAKQLAQPDFNQKFLAKLDEYHIPYSEVILELTESALISDFNLVISKMQFLKNKGVHFSLDDFGTGYSSLSYLHQLPISELKIDKSFVDNIKNSIHEVPIVNSIIQMAQALGLKVVAEGVECKEQLNYLAAHDCNVIQGYYFSKPLSAEHWLNLWQ